MASASVSSVKYQTPLRQAQRDLTRSRIKAAARNLFYERHYDTTTMDEIALAAGLRRSTLYLHYKDKSEILLDVIAEYTPKAKANLATLPGPKPSLEQVEKWAGTVARFVIKEQMPLSIIIELRQRQTHVDVMNAIITELVTGLGENNPRFLEAAAPTADPRLKARALMLLQSLTYACEMHLLDTSDARGKALVMIAAEYIHAFVSE